MERVIKHWVILIICMCLRGCIHTHTHITYVNVMSKEVRRWHHISWNWSSKKFWAAQLRLGIKCWSSARADALNCWDACLSSPWTCGFKSHWHSTNLQIKSFIQLLSWTPHSDPPMHLISRSMPNPHLKFESVSWTAQIKVSVATPDNLNPIPMTLGERREWMQQVDPCHAHTWHTARHTHPSLHSTALRH